jgi:NADH-quinone oxidoreductase subunit A
MITTIFSYELNHLGIFIIISLILTTVFVLASVLFGLRKPYTEKIAAYECGFDPFEDARNVFDVRFYLVSILFIVFDLETMYFFPWCNSLSKLSTEGIYIYLDFVFELIVGYIYAWRIGALEWD